jgi:WD40 repeat protein
MLIGHNSPIRAIAISPVERKIFSSSEDGTVRVWDAATGNYLETLKDVSYKDNVDATALSSDGRTIVNTQKNKMNIYKINPPPTTEGTPRRSKRTMPSSTKGTPGSTKKRKATKANTKTLKTQLHALMDALFI